MPSYWPGSARRAASSRCSDAGTSTTRPPAPAAAAPGAPAGRRSRPGPRPGRPRRRRPWTSDERVGRAAYLDGTREPQRRAAVSPADAGDAQVPVARGEADPDLHALRARGRSRANRHEACDVRRAARRRGPRPRPGRRSAARRPRRGAPDRCGPPRRGCGPERRRGPAAQPAAGVVRGARRSPGRAEAAVASAGTPAGRRGRPAARGRSSRAASARRRARRRGPGTARGRPPTNGGRPASRTGACSGALGQPGRTAPTNGIM